PELSLHHPGEPVVAGPAVEEVTLRRHALAVGREETGGRARFAEGQPDRAELMPAIAAVLLPLPAHPIDDDILRAVMQRVDRGLEEPLQGGFARANERLVRPRID